MSRFKALQKLLGVVGDDAAKVLEKIDTPELATSLTGQERAEYLQALDEVYGPQSKRAKDMGFGDETWYHGTNAGNIYEFSKDKIGTATDEGYAGKGYYFSSDPSVASVYADKSKGVVYPAKLRSENPYSFEGKNFYQEVKDAGGPEAFSNKIKSEGYDSADLWSQKMVTEPDQIRSVNAAFDPRFKNSPLIMAGAGAIPQADINPMEALKGIKENIAEPVVEKYNKLKSYVTGPLARQMNLSKDPEIEKGLKQGLDMGLDPVNLIPGGAGVGAGLLQLLGEKDEEE